MPNDIPDWTAQAKANLVGGISGLDLGDVGVPALQVDTFQETISSGNSIKGSAVGVLASFKPVPGTPGFGGNTGTPAVGTATSVSPTFAVATTAGNLLTAQVTSDIGEPTTGQAGWVKAGSTGGGGLWTAIWFKPNCGNNEVAPTFTAAGGSAAMLAILAEWTNVVTVSPLDQTGGQSTTTPVLALSGSAIDSGFGDLVLVATRWGLMGAGAPTFTDTLNNNPTTSELGQAQSALGGINVASNFVAFRTRTPTAAQPLGVAPWRYDATGTSNPSTGGQASVVLAATPGKAYTAVFVDWNAGQTAAATFLQQGSLLDGAAQLWLFPMYVTVTTGFTFQKTAQGLAIPGTTGNSMTIKSGNATASINQAVAIGAYLR